MNRQSRLSALDLKDIKIEGAFFGGCLELIRKLAIPYQWEALNDRIEGVEKSHCLENFRAVAGLTDDSFHGMVFQDTDISKWLEGAAYSLETKADPELEALCDQAIELIVGAQGSDGYLNTYYTLVEPEGRFTNLREGHELYNAGHLIEAAVAYHNATGKDALLQAAVRLVDYIDGRLGREPGKLRGYPGHPEIELALFRLYRATGEERFLRLACYFIDERGREPYYFDIESEKRGNTRIFPESIHFDRKYFQTHLPVREQRSAEGHAVRAMYLYSAMADVACETGDEELLSACRALFDNIVSRRMYLTGSIGSAELGERFTCDYDLPSDAGYSETCASIGLMMFANRMLSIDRKGMYGDIVETALYNTVLAGMARDGKSFFYVNPLEVWPEACEKNPNRRHVKPRRQGWFGVACCPPNIVRTVTSIGQYIYAHEDSSLYINQYISSSARMVFGGADVSLRMKTEYPFDGLVSLTLDCPSPAEFDVFLRIPAWAEKFSVEINSTKIAGNAADGYFRIGHTWGRSDSITVSFEMKPCFVIANPMLRADIGKLAIRRGPLVYCLEQADNGENLHEIAVLESALLVSAFEPNLLGGTVSVSFTGYRLKPGRESAPLYSVLDDRSKPEYLPCTLKAIPYFLWANRGLGEMSVWIRTL